MYSLFVILYLVIFLFIHLTDWDVFSSMPSPFNSAWAHARAWRRPNKWVAIISTMQTAKRFGWLLRTELVSRIVNFYFFASLLPRSTYNDRVSINIDAGSFHHYHSYNALLLSGSRHSDLFPFLLLWLSSSWFVEWIVAFFGVWVRVWFCFVWFFFSFHLSLLYLLSWLVFHFSALDNKNAVSDLKWDERMAERVEYEECCKILRDEM